MAGKTDHELLIRIRADLQKALKELEQFNVRINQTGKDAGSSSGHVHNLGKKIDDSGNQAGKSSGQIQKLDNSIKSTGNHAGKSAGQVKGLGSSFNYLRNTVAAYLTLRTAQQVVGLADSYNVLQTRIRTATKDTGDYKKVSAQLYDISQKNGVALADTVSVFQRLARSGPALGATTDEMVTLTNVVQQLGVIGGSTNAQLSAGLLQFSQALSAGNVRAEETNSILENIPEVADRIEKSLGLFPGTLKDAVNQGKILSKDVFRALVRIASEVTKEFNDIPNSVQRSGVTLSNSFSKFLGQLDQATGVTSTISENLQDLAKLFDSTDAQAFLSVLRQIAIVAASLGAGRVLGPLFASIAIGALQAARNITIMNQGLQVSRARLLLVGQAAAFFRNTMALLGGPAGIIIGAATALTLWSTTSKEAKRTTDEVTNSIDKLTTKYKELSAVQLEAALVTNKKNIADLAEQERIARAQLETINHQGRYLRNADAIEKHNNKTILARAKLEEITNKLNKAEQLQSDIQTRLNKLRSNNKPGNPPNKLSKEQEDLQKKIEATVKALELEAQTAGLAAGEVALYKLQIQGATKAQLDRAAAAIKTIEDEKAFQDAVKASEDAVKQQREEYVQWIKSLDDAAERVRQMIDPTRDLKKQLQQLTVLRNADKISAEEYAAAQKIIKQRIDEVNRSMDEASKFAEEAARNIQDALGQELYDILSGNFDDIGKSFERMILRMIAEAQAAQLAKYLIGDFGKTGKLGGVAGQFFGSILGRADGGIVSGPGTATSDSIPARLSDGEYVVRAAAVRRYGASFLESINRMRYPNTSIPRISMPTHKFAEGGLAVARGNGREVILNMTVVTPDANSFKRSESQLGLIAGRQLTRVMNRKN